MATLSKAAVHEALDRAAKILLKAGGTNDKLISRDEVRDYIQDLPDDERNLAENFYNYILARENAGRGVTEEHVERAVAYVRKHVLDKYDLNNDGFSKSEIAEMSELGQSVTELAQHLKRAAGNGKDKK